MNRTEGVAPRGCGLRVTGLLVCTIIWAAQPTAAQDSQGYAEPGALGWAGLTGSIRAGYWSSTQNLDPEQHLAAGMIWLKSTRRVASRVSFLIEGWTALHGPVDDGDARGELREAFVDLGFGRLDLRVGRQIVAWGRADGINPTDNLTGEDLTLLTSDDEDRRFGTTTLRASYYLGGISLTGLWLPEFRGHRVPLPTTPGLTFVGESSDWPGDQWAIRTEQTGREIDWSISYFQGLDLAPDLGPGLASAMAGSERVVSLSHHRIRVVGADLAASVGRIGLRAEGAYIDTEDDDGRDPFTKNPYLFIVVGGDRTFREYLNLNVQYIYRLVRHHGMPGGGLSPAEADLALLQETLNSQTRRLQHGASFRVSYKWLRETLEGECAAVGFFGPGGLALQPKLAYTLSDDWKALVGGELYRGESSSLFGVLRPNSTAHVEVRWSF